MLLPIRAVAESMSAEVPWTEGVRKIGNVVGIQKDSRYIGFCVEDTGYNENYNPYHMMIRDGDTKFCYWYRKSRQRRSVQCFQNS